MSLVPLSHSTQTKGSFRLTWGCFHFIFVIVNEVWIWDISYFILNWAFNKGCFFIRNRADMMFSNGLIFRNIVFNNG